MKRIWLIRSVILALGLNWASLAIANGAKQSLEQFNSEVSQASGKFKQVIFTPEGRLKQEGQGEFSFSKPGQFKWEIKTPFPQIIVSDGNTVVTYDPDLEQASRRQAEDALSSSPAALLFGRVDMDKLFNVSAEQSNTDGLAWLSATPLKADSLYEKIRIGMRDGKPTEVEIHDSLGQITRLSLFGWSLNPEFSASQFRFVPPKGVDVIEVR